MPFDIEPSDPAPERAEEFIVASRLVAAAVLGSLLGPRLWPSGTFGALLFAGGLLTLAGWLERRRAARQRTIRRLRERCQAARGFKPALLVALDELTSIFHASGARITVRGAEPDSSARWTYRAASRELSYTENPSDEPHEPTLAAPFAAGAWTGLVEILEPRRRSPRAVHFLKRVVLELTPLLQAAHGQASMRARAAREERATLARELHDGPIQSLIGAEMSLEALRRQARLDAAPSGFESGLNDAQRILRQEIAGLRELMVRMRPLDLPPGGLPAYLAAALRRFSRESGIRAEFVAEDRSATPLPRQHAVGLARIVHEALTNVRKHSAATRVVVSLHKHADATHLVVSDNGRGFDVQQPCATPEFIDATARELGADLRVESSPGRGVRLEVVVARPGRQTAALQKAAS